MFFFSKMQATGNDFIVLNNMENAKLILRVCEETDARKRRIVLTEEAYEIYEEMVKTKQEAIDSIIKDISLFISFFISSRM